jgi:peptidoglycan-associated lipoprotein
MKSIVLSSVAIAMLVFSGCADKEPVVEKKTEVQKTQDTTSTKKADDVQTETVSTENVVINENTTSSSESDEMKIARLQGELSTVYFDYDRFNIRADMKDKISSDADVANSEASEYGIKLEGNCDEWGSDEYNIALGLKRASSVKKALVAQGVDASRISMVSYGESNPVCTDKTKECWAKNRRVDFKLLP